ncbi:hypothetical protein HK099_003385 [Clydaea vesicula]|uniref:Uncharacterized protein n=1 Tax=Clydaea vesicula TaxID=447962 RepID=A0AAD5XYW2_9FUNG|nr:hypothetical protein HK099_003385 [Clydaea vesicula]
MEVDERSEKLAAAKKKKDTKTNNLANKIEVLEVDFSAKPKNEKLKTYSNELQRFDQGLVTVATTPAKSIISHNNPKMLLEPENEILFLRSQIESQKQAIDLLIDEKSDMQHLQDKIYEKLQQQVNFNKENTESIENYKNLINNLENKVDDLVIELNASNCRVDKFNSEVNTINEMKNQKAVLLEKCRLLSEANNKLESELLNLRNNQSIVSQSPQINYDITANNFNPTVEKLMSTVEKLNSTIADQGNKLETAYLEISDLREKLSIEEGRNTVLAEELLEMQRDKTVKFDTNNQLSTRLMDYEGKLIHVSQENFDLKAENDKLKVDLENSTLNLNTVNEKLLTLENLRSTWLAELEEKKKLNALVSSSNDKLAKLQSENNEMINGLEELRERHIIIVEEKLGITEENEKLKGKIKMLILEVEALEIYKDEIQRLKEMIRNYVEGSASARLSISDPLKKPLELETSECKSLESLQSELQLVRRESEVIIDKWRNSEDKYVSAEKRADELENKLRLSICERDSVKKDFETGESLKVELNETKEKLKILDVKLLQTLEENSKCKNEVELIKAIWKHEKDNWGLEKLKLEKVISDFDVKSRGQNALNGIASTSDTDNYLRVMPNITKAEPVLSKETSPIKSSPVSASAVVPDSVILTELENLKTLNLTLLEKLTNLQEENRKISDLLENEKKLNVLLTAEVDSLPDYIFMYHQERKALLAQMQKMVLKIQREANLKLMMEKKKLNSSLIWSSKVFDSPSNKKLVKDLTSNDGMKSDIISFEDKKINNSLQEVTETKLNKEKVQEVFREKGKFFGGGMCLRGYVDEVLPCKNLYSISNTYFKLL